LITTETNEQYHANDAIGSTSVKSVALNSVAHWFGTEVKSSPAMAFGSAVHANFLEPEKNLVHRGPETRRGKAWTELEEGMGPDEILLPVAEYHRAEKATQALRDNMQVEELWSMVGWQIERSIYVTCPETGLDLKCKPDGFNERLRTLIDVKTCQTAAPAAWQSQYGPFFKFGYHIQMAFYMYVCGILKLKMDTANIFAVESNAPHAVQCFDISQDTLRHGHAIMLDTLKLIAEAKEAGEYTTGWPDWVEL